MFSKLVNLFLKENFSLKRILGFDYKKSKIKAILIGLAIVYALAVFIGAFGWMFFDLGKVLHQMQQTRLILNFLVVYIIGLSVIIVFFRANGSLFHYKDYEILSPLPIHPRTVLMAKLSVLLIILYVSSFLLTLPIVFSYFYWTGFSFTSAIIYFFAFLVLPLVPVVIMSLIALGLSFVTSRFRKSKLLNIILLFSFFIGIILWSFSLNETTLNPLTGQIEIFNGLSKNYPPMSWFMMAIHEKDLFDLLLLVLTHIIVFTVFVFGIQSIVNYTNQRGLRQNIKADGKPIKYQERGILSALVQKEVKKFFSIPLYAVNAGLGPVLLVVLSIGSLFYRSQIEGLLVEMVGSGLQVEVLLMILIGFCIAMTYTSAISLSLEGKNFWIVKSLPIKAEKIMLAKIVFNLLIILPITVISILLFGLSMQLLWYNQLLLILLASIFAVLISSMNAVINLYMPKFNFMNEVEVIKQSAGAFLGIFGGFALMITNGLVFFLLQKHLSFELLLICLTSLNFLLAFPFVMIVKVRSQKLFNKMQA